MLENLRYPINGDYLCRKCKSIRRTLLSREHIRYTEVRIAILGGSTTNEVKNQLEIFLLSYDIKPVFYESEYNRFYEEAVFNNEKLADFSPNIIYIHTCVKNIMKFPSVKDSPEEVDELLQTEYEKYYRIWENVFDQYHCVLIQNNFEYPSFRIYGNSDVIDIHGRVRFVNRLNNKFYEYAEKHENFYINDINYLSSCYGLDRWSNQQHWHMYKYCCEISAISELAGSVAKIIKALYGKNKKGLVLDLDNTIWGGCIGEDGLEGITLGNEDSIGALYCEFQSYLKELSERGVLLSINSKNDLSNVEKGFTHPDAILAFEDFIVVKANWMPKDENFESIAKELNLLPESLVFTDDNPAERNIVKSQFPGVETPNLEKVEEYVRMIDKAGYFEAVNLSKDDVERNVMYKQNSQRLALQKQFSDYTEYLCSLQMVGEVNAFSSMYITRITQLINKTNQFNLTAKRYSQAEINEMASDNKFITLYGRLRDKFGDNGIVSVIIGRKECHELHIDLWVMSCRVFKRGFEYAMIDTLIEKCYRQGIIMIHGYYIPTEKNSLVATLYKKMGFICQEKDLQTGGIHWTYKIPDHYIKKNKIIILEV